MNEKLRRLLRGLRAVRPRHLELLRWLLLAICCGFAGLASAANLPLVFRQTGTAAQLLQGSDGNFYGPGGQLTGNTFSAGIVRLTPEGVLTFLAQDNTSSLSALIEGSDGNFYGTAANPGANSSTIFKLTPAGVMTVLHTFTPPYASTLPLVRAADGTLYGIATGDPNTSIFKLAVDGTFTTIATIPASCSGCGFSGFSGLTLGSDGNLYAVSRFGEIQPYSGQIYQVTPAGVVTVLHTFNGQDGDDSQSAPIEVSPGVFWGTTGLGGKGNSGVIYQITATGVFTILHYMDVTAGDGAEPYEPLVKAGDGNIYGPARTSSEQQAGTLFRLTPSGVFSVVYSFVRSGVDGFTPEWLTPTADGNLYGMTVNYPSIFELYLKTPAAPTMTLSASPSSVIRGGQVTLSWGSTDTGSCTAGSGWTGTQQVGGSKVVTAAVVGPISYKLNCSGPGGSVSRIATVNAGTPVPTVTMQVPSPINIGLSTTLTWSTIDATACTASGAWSGSRATSGSFGITPPAAGSYTYTLNCTGPGGSNSGSATLQVQPLPTVNIGVNPIIINLGQSATLSWSTTDAAACTASSAWSGTKSSSGTQMVKPTAAGSFIYTLTCSNTVGQQAASTVLTVQGGGSSSGGSSSSSSGSSSSSSGSSSGSSGSSSNGGGSSGGGGGGGGGGAAGFGLLLGLGGLALLRHRRSQGLRLEELRRLQG